MSECKTPIDPVHPVHPSPVSTVRQKAMWPNAAHNVRLITAWPPRISECSKEDACIGACGIHCQSLGRDALCGALRSMR